MSASRTTTGADGTKASNARHRPAPARPRSAALALHEQELGCGKRLTPRRPASSARGRVVGVADVRHQHDADDDASRRAGARAAAARARRSASIFRPPGERRLRRVVGPMSTSPDPVEAISTARPSWASSTAARSPSSRRHDGIPRPRARDHRVGGREPPARAIPAGTRPGFSAVTEGGRSSAIAMTGPREGPGPRPAGSGRSGPPRRARPPRAAASSSSGRGSRSRGPLPRRRRVTASAGSRRPLPAPARRRRSSGRSPGRPGPRRSGVVGPPGVADAAGRAPPAAPPRRAGGPDRLAGPPGTGAATTAGRGGRRHAGRRRDARHGAEAPEPAGARVGHDRGGRDGGTGRVGTAAGRGRGRPGPARLPGRGSGPGGVGRQAPGR